MSKFLLRPPGAVAEADFLGRCIRCGKCALVCPHQAIRVAGLLDGFTIMGTPVIRARQSPCYLCMKCPPVCPSGALDKRVQKREQVRMGTARLNRKECLNWQGTFCRSCYDHCPLFNEAIIMDAELRPVVQEKKCTGCGVCEHVCPAEPAAIIVIPGGAG
ncbi:MAG TPA: 4Fe-4S dicluster domain-containing protein, partial [Desulfurivibrionaceae bacterium]|nr:4Fe-4S dicluster domain-containing protein [Desulfurivibrionaceae bacterium]